ncbi:hypothetical protein B0O80DRAFT_308198 [Mortierella sp. GBAus27b]|nr:hypothetical protein B0O80DRAFT_308198 [Mortierella sp. GBAus27b]
MTDPSRESISHAPGIDIREDLDARLAQESEGFGDNTVHGIPPFTMPCADGTLDADIHETLPGTATAKMTRRRQHEIGRSDQDGDGYHTNLQGHRDGYEGRGAFGNKSGNSRYGHGVATRKPFLYRLRKATIPTLVGALIAWYYDAVGVLIYRNDPRIKGNLLTFSLLCLSAVLSIFLYLDQIRPRVLGKKTEYVKWEKELLYPVRIATVSLIVGSIGSNIALWPVWHLSTIFVLTAIAVALVNFLSIFF